MCKLRQEKRIEAISFGKTKGQSLVKKEKDRLLVFVGKLIAALFCRQNIMEVADESERKTDRLFYLFVL